MTFGQSPQHTHDDTTSVTYVAITSMGELLVRTVSDRLAADEWGCHYQVRLWAAVHAEVDPYHSAVNGFALDHGLRAKIADVAMTTKITGAVTPAQLAMYPANSVASAMLTALGHPPRRWFGTIAIVGTEDDDAITASLSAEQLSIIARAHMLALGP